MQFVSIRPAPKPNEDAAHAATQAAQAQAAQLAAQQAALWKPKGLPSGAAIFQRKSEFEREISLCIPSDAGASRHKASRAATLQGRKAPFDGAFWLM